MYDLIVAGSGFASSFFLHQYLKVMPESARVLVVEKGPQLSSHEFNRNYKQIVESISDQVELQNTSKVDKSWLFTTALGGGSNCWWACTPRFIPNDFRMYSAYGIGLDWPLSYDDIEKYYCMAEVLMSVSGERSWGAYRSIPFPQPPHVPNSAHKVLASHYPDDVIIQPTARSRISAHRPACCASGYCHKCPIQAKFIIGNDFKSVFKDSRVELLTDAEVLSVGTSSNQVSELHYIQGGKEQTAKGEFFVLGMNAINNPMILHQSGITHPLLGKGLHEQLGIEIIYHLDGIDSLDGSTSISGLMYSLYDTPERRSMAGALIELYNTYQDLRIEEGKWQQVLKIKLILEDLPQRENYVEFSKPKPTLHFTGYSDYLNKSVMRSLEKLDMLLSKLPIEKKAKTTVGSTEGHIIGTAPMGIESEKSIVDSTLVHHKYRNLVVAGSSAFPTSTPSNPSLTIAALSLRAAAQIFGSGP